MAMINAHPGWCAYFAQASGHHTSKPVEAWDENGDPMVVDSNLGLMSARGFKNFSHVGRETSGPYVTAVPGQGWYVHRTDDDGTTWDDPVIAFVIDRHGEAAIVLGTGDGEVMADVLVGEKNVLTPPGGWSNSTTTKES